MFLLFNSSFPLEFVSSSTWCNPNI